MTEHLFPRVIYCDSFKSNSFQMLNVKNDNVRAVEKQTKRKQNVYQKQQNVHSVSLVVVVKHCPTLQHLQPNPEKNTKYLERFNLKLHFNLFLFVVISRFSPSPLWLFCV